MSPRRTSRRQPRRSRKPKNRNRHRHGHGQCANAVTYLLPARLILSPPRKFAASAKWKDDHIATLDGGSRLAKPRSSRRDDPPTLGWGRNITLCLEPTSFGPANRSSCISAAI